MTLSDLNPEVTAFFEVEHLGPDYIFIYVRWDHAGIRLRMPIWPISDINALHIVSISYLLVCRTVGLVRNIFLHNAHVTHSYRLRFDCEETA